MLTDWEICSNCSHPTTDPTLPYVIRDLTYPYKRTHIQHFPFDGRQQNFLLLLDAGVLRLLVFTD